MGKKGFRVCPLHMETLFARLFCQVHFSQIGMSTLPFGYSLYFYLNLETTPIKFSNLHIKLFFFLNLWKLMALLRFRGAISNLRGATSSPAICKSDCPWKKLFKGCLGLPISFPSFFPSPFFFSPFDMMDLWSLRGALSRFTQFTCGIHLQITFFSQDCVKGNFDHNLEVSFNLERAPLKASRRHKSKKRQEKREMKGKDGHGAGEPYASPWKKRGKNQGQSEFQIADLDQAPLKLKEPSSHTLTQQREREREREREWGKEERG